MIDIIKKETGQVLLKSVGSLSRYEYLQAGASFRVSKDEERIEIMKNGIIVNSFTYDEVRNLQVEPAAATSKPADIMLLADELATNFFFDLGGFDGTVEEGLNFTALETVTVSATTNNLVVPNIEKIAFIDFNVTTGLTITGIVAPSPAKRYTYTFRNVGVGSAVFSYNNGLSDAANQFDGSGTQATIAAGATRDVYYDPVNLKFYFKTI